LSGNHIEDYKLKYGCENKVSSSSQDEEINRGIIDWRPSEVIPYQPTLKPSIAINYNVQNKGVKPHLSDEREKKSYEMHDINIHHQKRTNDGKNPSKNINQGTIKLVSHEKDAKIAICTSSSISTSNYSRHCKSIDFPIVPTFLANLKNSIEHEKLWHYVDPSGTIQGPFSIEQLRKWHGTGLFPIDLKIWKTTEEQNQSILLTDGLQGKFNIKHDHLCQVAEESNGKCQTSASAIPSNSKHNEKGLFKESSHVMINAKGLENIKPNGLIQLYQPIQDVPIINHVGTPSYDIRLKNIENL